jgi:signal transduction histidine kinase
MTVVNAQSTPRKNHLPGRKRNRLLAASTLVVITAISLASMVYILLTLRLPGPLPQESKPDSFSFLFVLTSILFGLLAALILHRRPGNRIAWVMAVIGGFMAVENLGSSAGGYIFATQGLRQAIWWGWLGSWSYVPPVLMALIFLPLLFPDGKLPQGRWLFPVWSVAFWVLAVGTSAAVMLRALDPDLLSPVANPAGVGITRGLYAVVYPPVLLGGVATAATALIVRYRRGDQDLRHQVKWLAAALALVALMLAVYLVGVLTVQGIRSGTGGQAPSLLIRVIFTIALTTVPSAVAISILKYRLYDIDLVISRALVYAALAALITAIYVGIAVGIGSLVGSGGKPNLGLSILATAIVAVGFQPARERLRKVANRLVYGRRATPYEVLSQFSERVAESYASADVLPRMARVLAEGTNADLAEVWLRSGDVLQRAAAFPLQPSPPAAVHLNGAAEQSIPNADRSIVVRHQGEVLGALTVTKRRGEQITPIEVKLMDDLAHQAGLVLKNVGLTSDLQARLADLRASRQRLVAAQDDERRRLERNLHDGAQQHLVAIKVKLGLAEMLATRDPQMARAAVAELKHDADEALETLRDLARGIYPPLLADKGLPTALQAQARKATLPVTIEADGIGRYPRDTEAALYFCILEALQNIQKYAQASSAVVRLREDGDQLAVEVADNGRGFDVSTTVRGNGLTNMEDRLEALGGTLNISSTPGSGTRLRAAVPVPYVMVVS